MQPNHSRLLVLFLALTLASSLRAAEQFITLASTTSTQASGFFEYFLPLFTQRTGIEVRPIAVGTGQALKIGEAGDADVLLVHDKAGELKFVDRGFGIDRREVMYNDFVLVGPAVDPAGVKQSGDVIQAFLQIAKAKSVFISRGDDSGTNRLELRIWAQAPVDVKAVSGTWYKDIGAGMGAALNTAAGLDAYTLADRASWLSFKNRGRLRLLQEGDPQLFNQYSVILVNPAKHPHVKREAALKFMDFMTSAEGQQLIGAMTVEGQTLFHPNAGQRTTTP